MTQRNDGGPAYPVPRDWRNVGMSLRDAAAIAAMQGFISAGYLNGVQNYGLAEAQLARDSLSAADALLAAGERK